MKPNLCRTALLITMLALPLTQLSGCAVTRGQETMGAYMEDSAITASVKARFVGNKEVDAASITVETLNGVVMLSGFARNAVERATAESIAAKVSGVKAVKNNLVIKP